MSYVGKQPLPAYDYEDQGQFGTCVGNGICHQLEYEVLDLMPSQQLKFSPLFLYRNAKVIEGNTDEGTNPVFAYQSLMKQGVCLEQDMPYSLLNDIHNLPTPSQTAINNALKYKIKSFTQLDTTTAAIDKALDSGKVINVGTLCFDNFAEATNEGFIGLAEGHILGGHDYVIIGRDDLLQHTINNKTYTGFYHIQNSWARQQTAWVAKDFIAEKLDYGQPILSGAWIVDTGWVAEPQPAPVPTPTPNPQPTPEPTKLYHVQVGAYSKRENADAMVQKLKGLGIDSFIKYE
jgi:hypothetical protein